MGSQYIDKKNVPDKDVNPKGYGLPIVSIYILGHKLGDLQEPVVYVRRKYLDYNSNPIENGVPDPFIESLTHDSIIIQIPYHIMEIDERGLEIEEQLVVDRLIKAAVEPDVRRDMDVEDEILSEIESRDTTIMMKNKELELKNKELESKSQELESKSQELESKSQELESKSQELESKSQELESKSQELESKSQELESKSQELESKSQELISKNKMLGNMISLLIR